MRTMTAKYPGVCKRTGQTIQVGDQINYFGKGHAELALASCRADYGFSESEEYTGIPANVREDDYRAEVSFGLAPGTLASDRRSARNGLLVTRYASGHTSTQNSRGRCEDAPCCGCCS